MEGNVTWPQLFFIAGLTVAANGFTGFLVYRVCQIIGRIETRLAVIEALMGKKEIQR